MEADNVLVGILIVAVNLTESMEGRSVTCTLNRAQYLHRQLLDMALRIVRPRVRKKVINLGFPEDIKELNATFTNTNETKRTYN